MPPEPHNFTALRDALKKHEYNRLRSLEANRGISDTEIKKMARHFTILSEQSVFRFIEEE